MTEEEFDDLWIWANMLPQLSPGEHPAGLLTTMCSNTDYHLLTDIYKGKKPPYYDFSRSVYSKREKLWYKCADISFEEAQNIVLRSLDIL